jgi:hypothetical protein
VPRFDEGGRHVFSVLEFDRGDVASEGGYVPFCGEPALCPYREETIEEIPRGLPALPLGAGEQFGGEGALDADHVVSVLVEPQRGDDVYGVAVDHALDHRAVRTVGHVKALASVLELGGFAHGAPGPDPPLPPRDLMPPSSPRMLL